MCDTAGPPSVIRRTGMKKTSIATVSNTDFRPICSRAVETRLSVISAPKLSSEVMTFAAAKPLTHALEGRFERHAAINIGDIAFDDDAGDRGNALQHGKCV